jgi:hypothetical protein
MELSPSREAASCPATQELPSILWNPTVHYSVHKNTSLVPTLPKPDQSSPYHPHPISLIGGSLVTTAWRVLRFLFILSPMINSSCDKYYILVSSIPQNTERQPLRTEATMHPSPERRQQQARQIPSWSYFC